jgi:erythritol transport system permease protein
LSAAAETQSGGRLANINWNSVLVEGRALVALAIIIVVFASISDKFLEPGNLIIMTRHVAINAIIAIGMLMAILHGGIDLSVGSTVGLSAIVAGYLLNGWDLPLTEMVAYPAVWVVVVISISVGALVGLVNGLLVAKLNIAPFIATLGMLYVARGLALVISNGLTFTRLDGDPTLGNTGFLTVFRARALGIPAPIWFMIAFAIIFSILLTKTPFGRWLYAVGGNERAAELSGVPVAKVKTWVYVLSGICAAVVGLLLAADLTAATPRSGELYELNAIGAVVIGGAALSGGRGTIRGTLIGAFVIGFLVDGLVLVGVSVFWQQVIKGAVIILAVAVDQLQQMYSKKRAADRASRPPSDHGPQERSEAKEVVGTH